MKPVIKVDVLASVLPDYVETDPTELIRQHQGYIFNPAPDVTCIVNVAEFNNVYEGNFRIWAIAGPDRLIYELAFHTEPANFTRYFFSNVKNKTEDEFWTHLLKHGLFMIDRSGSTIDSTMASYCLEPMMKQILPHLDREAIEVLKSIELGVVPSLYNWIAETSGERRTRRIEALRAYPAVFSCNVSPLFELFVPEMDPSAQRERDPLTSGYPGDLMTALIDAGASPCEVLEECRRADKEDRYDVQRRTYHDFIAMENIDGYFFGQEMRAYMDLVEQKFR